MKKVTIFSTIGPDVRPGDTIVLSSVLEGFGPDEEPEFQWECDKGDGFEAVAGATEDSYEYEATEESIGWSWRLIVSY